MAELSDLELIRKTREGDSDAYGQLYKRHADAGHRLAVRYSNGKADREDLVSTSFADVLASISRGKGPTEVFRTYLLTTIRNNAIQAFSRRRDVPMAESAFAELATVDDDPVIREFDQDTAMEAFESLPERWQLVLWHSVVEEEPREKVAELLGVSSSAVSSLAFRAKEGLRDAFLAKHVSMSDCGMDSERLAKFARGGLSERNAEQVQAHLETCASCRELLAQLSEVNQTLRAVIAPAILTIPLALYLEPIARSLKTGGGLLAAFAASKSALVVGLGAILALVGAGVFLITTDDTATTAADVDPPNAASVVVVTPSASVEQELPEVSKDPERGPSAVPSTGSSAPVTRSPDRLDVPAAADPAEIGVTQSAVPTIVRGGVGTVRLYATLGDSAATLKVRLPSSVTLRQDRLPTACESSGSLVTCTGLSGVYAVDFVVEMGDAGTSSDGSAWLEVDGRAASSPIPVSVSGQGDDCD